VTANHQRRVALPSSIRGVLVLRVVGEIDLITVGGLREQLHQYLSSDCRGLVLDFTGVSFLAACGIGLLVEIANRTRVTGKALRLVTGSQLVQRALEITRADQAISRAITVAEALAHCAV
jgi:anti-sigma B factor antagonist